jgi:hypothetical protein
MIKLKTILRELISKNYNYVGNCVTGLDDPYFQKNVCSDATEMSNIVDESNNIFVSADEFIEQVKWPDVLGSINDEKFDFAFNPRENIYWAYDIEQDIHYFFIKDKLSEIYTTPGSGATPTYDVDGEILQVISVYNLVTKRVLSGGSSKLNPTDWEFDRHGELRSISGGTEGYSTQRSVFEDPKASKIVDDALFNIGWRVGIEENRLVFIPLK